MDKGTFLYDEALGELVRELREGLKTGRMRYEDALEILKSAIKKAISEKAVEVNQEEN